MSVDFSFEDNKRYLYYAQAYTHSTLVQQIHSTNLFVHFHFPPHD